MFARRIYMHLKPNSATEFTQKLEREVIPVLRKQKGFLDEITFIDPSGIEAFAISLSDKSERAEAYSPTDHAEVTKTLAPVVDGPAQVETFNVANSTFHKLASPVMA